MRVGADADDLAAELVIEPQPFGVRQRRVAAVDVALNAAAIFNERAEHLRHLVLEAVETHVHTVVFVHVAKRQRQVAEHRELSPLGRLQNER